jgi:hypothetical protein
LKRREFYQTQKIESQDKLVQIYIENLTRDNMPDLHTHCMKTWKEIDEITPYKAYESLPKDINLQEVIHSKKAWHESFPKDLNLQEVIHSKKAWMVYPMKTKYLQFAKVFFVRVRYWDTVGLEDCEYSKAFQDYMEYSDLELYEPILLVETKKALN